MFASKHGVFVGPGKLPDEVWQQSAHRTEANRTDPGSLAPRLLGLFETAAEAERIASQIQSFKLGVAVVGPEQPPSEGGWVIATSCTFLNGTWRIDTASRETHLINPVDISAVTLLDWRPEHGAVDRAALVTLREGRPVVLRASGLDTVSAHAFPHEGMKHLNDFLDTASTIVSPQVRIRSRQVSEGEVRGTQSELHGDLFTLMLAVIDRVDTTPGQLPHPIQSKAFSPLVKPPHFTALAAFAAWVLYGVSLCSLILSLACFAIAVMSLHILPGLMGLALGAWGTRRFMWSRWLGRANWGQRNPIPHWPISETEPGLSPRMLELGLDASTLILVCLGALSEGLLRALSLSSLPIILLAVLTSAGAVYESWQRE